jgi:hypothetical protein
VINEDVTAIVIDGIPVPTTAISATAFVSLIVMLVLFGYLVPRWMHNERVRDKDKQIDYLTIALDKRDDQVEKLLDQGQLVLDLLDEIKEEAQRR